MNKPLALVFLVLILFAHCTNTVPVKNGQNRTGCWHEKANYREVCGSPEQFNRKDSTYTMRTADGWAMQVKAAEISWK